MITLFDLLLSFFFFQHNDFYIFDFFLFYVFIMYNYSIQVRYIFYLLLHNYINIDNMIHY